jgi:YcaO-like protein with predicted kinase domain
VSQGKGADDDAAMASAVFEAAELAIAERSHLAAFTATRVDLIGAGRRVIDSKRFLRRGANDVGNDESASWIEGLDLLSGETMVVPEDVVRLVDAPDCRYCQTSDGLGTGSNLLEAAIHGICEVIERDAIALWSLHGEDEIALREIDTSDLKSDEVNDVEKRIRSAGLSTRLFDATSNTLVPTFLAVVLPADRPLASLSYLDLATGSGAHPITERAALRAITEAAQTRLTTITGSRDDLDPKEYSRILPQDLRVYANHRGQPSGKIPPTGYVGERSLPAYLDWLLDRIRAVGIRTLALVPFEVPDFPFAVARILAPDFEQDPRSGNRRPGRRLLSAMLAG